MKLAALIVACSAFVLADSKDAMIADLRTKLAASEASRKALQSTLIRLGEAQAKSSQAAKVERASASDAATANAANAKDTADANAVEARGTAQDARVQTAVDAQASKSQLNVVIVTTASGAFITIVGFVVQSFNEGRKRRWAVEDAQRLEVATIAKHNVVVCKVDKAIDRAQAAYDEANTVNKKLESIGVEMKDGQPLSKKDDEEEKAKA